MRNPKAWLNVKSPEHLPSLEGTINVRVSTEQGDSAARGHLASSQHRPTTSESAQSPHLAPLRKRTAQGKHFSHNVWQTRDGTGSQRAGFVRLGQGFTFQLGKKKKRKVTLPVLRYGGYKWCIPVNCHLTVGIKVYQNLKKKRQGEKILLIHGTANITHILKLDANTS